MSAKSVVIKAICAAIVLALLGGLVIFLSAPTEEIREEIFTVISCDESSLKRIEVLKEKPYCFESDGKKWVLEGMEDIGVNHAYVASLGKSMSHITSPMLTEDNADDLSKYGLASPQIEVRLSYAEHEEVIKIGNESGAFNYVTVSDSRDVYIVSKADLYMAFMEKMDYVDLTAVKLNAEAVQKITVGDVTLKKIGGEWFEEKPYERMADAGKVKTLLTSLSEVTAEEIVTHESIGLEMEKSLSVRVIAECENEKIDFYVTSCDDNFSYLKHNDSDYVYKVRNSQVSFAETTGFDLMIKYVCPVAISEVKEIKMISPEKTTILSIDAPSTQAPLFYKNSKQVTEESFRGFYQILMGLTVKGEGSANGAAEYAIVITKETGDVTDVRFINANDMEYAVSIDGRTQFVIAKKSVTDVFEYLKSIEEV